MKTNQSRNFMNTTAASALLILMGAAAPVLAQSTVDLEFNSDNVATANGDRVAVEDQLNSGAISAATSGNAINITATASGSVSLTTVSGTLNNNTVSSTASANITEANVLLDVAPSGGSETSAIGVIQELTASGSVTATSSGNSNLISVQGQDPTSDEVTFVGTILADNNDTSATANGNVGVTRIAVSGGASLAGTGSGAVVVIDEALGGSTDSDTEADLLISSAQSIRSTVTATSTNDDTTVILQSVSGSTVTLSNSDVTSSANGNDYTATLSVNDGRANEIGASAAMASLQETSGAVSATTTLSDISLYTGSVSSGSAYSVSGNTDTSTLTVSANTQTSAAYGNDSSQTLSFNATTLSGDVASGSISDSSAASGAVQLSATADLVVASVQTQSAAVSATTSSSTISANADDEGTDSASGSIASTTVNVTSNTQSAFAMGADANNTLTITSNAASATGAVAAVQSNDSTVSADVTGSNVLLNVGSGSALEGASGSTFELSSNRQTATAAGAQAVNALTLSDGSNNLSVAANSGSVSILADVNESSDVAQPTVTSAYALTNDQSSTSGSVSATVTNSDMDLVFVGGASGGSIETLTDSTTINDSNVQSATAYGLTAGNSISLSFNNLEGTSTTAVSGAVVAGVANQQTQSGATVTATNTSTDNRAVLTDIDDNVAGSSLSTSSNQVTASAFGNRTTANSVTVDATNIVLANGQVATPEISEAADSGGNITATADFVAASSQEFENGSVTATQVSGSTSNWVYTDVSGTVNTSTVASDSNTLSVAATANTANNATSIGTVTTSTLEASSAVANYQDVTSGNVTATLGTAGTAATPPYSSSNTSAYDGNGTTGDAWDNSTKVLKIDTAVAGGVRVFDFPTPLTTEEISILNAAFGSNGSLTDADTYTVTATTSDDGSRQSFDLTGLLNAGTDAEDGTRIFNFVSAGTLYSPNTAGVIARTEGASITDSTVTVLSNTVSGEVTGNTATNAVTATATTLTSNNTVDATITESGNSVIADHALSSVQSVDAGTVLPSNVFGAFGSLQATDQSVSGSTITVSNNTQTSTGTANNVTNTVSLTGSSSTDANSALFNEQTSNGDVTTGSDMEVFANAGMNASTLSLNSNVNESVATSNAATNSVTLSSANASSAQTAADGIVSGGAAVSADQALVSDQTAGGASGAVATATTTVFNNDLTDTTGGRIVSSTVSMDSNSTTARATSNLATNTMTLNVDNMEATGALANYQTSSQATTATTTTSVALNQQNSSGGSGVNLLSGSVASVDKNSATARATGNSSTNTVTLTGTNVDAGSTGTDVSLNTSGSSGVVADAAYLLVNETSNTGTVTATSTSATYQVDLQSSGGTVLNSSVSLSSNTSTADAMGNSAVNRMNIGQDGSMTSISSNAGIVNSQSNTAAINASGSATVQATIDTTASDTTAAVSGSSINVDNNSTVAMARGNISTNILNVAATLADGGTGSAGSMTADSQTLAATYGVLNSQTNDGPVSGTVSGASYQALVNQGSSYSGGSALNGSSVSVTGNIIQAYGYGNISTNGVNMTSLAGGANDATLAAGNIQNNTGAISATISGSTIGSTSLGTVTGSRLSVGGNNLASTAVGNFAITNVTRN
jgi:hypothetical protein